MNPRGRRVAIAIAVIGAATILAAGIAARERLIEEWCIWRFRTGDAEGRKAAAAALCERRSVRAVRVFLDRFLEKGQDPGEDYVSQLLAALERPQMESLAPLTRGEDPTRVILLAQLFGGVKSTRTSFLPVLRVALRSENSDLRRWAAEEIARLGREASEAADDLRQALQDPNDLVRLWAEIALQATDPGASGRKEP